MKNIILTFFCAILINCKKVKNTNYQNNTVVKINKTEVEKNIHDSIADNFLDRKKYKSEYNVDGSVTLLFCNDIKKGYFLVRFYSNDDRSKEIWKVQEETYKDVLKSSEKYIFKNIEDYTQVAFSISTKYFEDLSENCPFPKDIRLISIYKRKGEGDWKYVKTISDSTYWHEFLNYESYDIGKKVVTKAKR